MEVSGILDIDIKDIRKSFAKEMGIPEKYLFYTLDEIDFYEQSKEHEKNLNKLNKLASHFRECEK